MKANKIILVILLFLSVAVAIFVYISYLNQYGVYTESKDVNARNFNRYSLKALAFSEGSYSAYLLAYNKKNQDIKDELLEKMGVALGFFSVREYVTGERCYDVSRDMYDALYEMISESEDIFSDEIVGRFGQAMEYTRECVTRIESTQWIATNRLLTKNDEYFTKTHETINTLNLLSLLLILILAFTIYQMFRFEKRIKERNSSLNALLEAIPSMVLITDGKKMNTCNKKTLKVLGFDSFEELKAEHDCICDFFLPGEGYLQKMQNGYGWLEYMLLNRGEYKVLIYDASLQKKRIFKIDFAEHRDTKKIFIILLTDITEVIEMQNALKDSESKYRLIAQNSSDVIWTMDFDGVLTYISPSIESVRGYKPQELIGKGVDTLVANKKSFDEIKNMLVDAKKYASLGMSHPPILLELEQQHADGHPVWVEVSAKVMLGDSGEPIGIIGISRDISEQRQYHEQMRIFNQELLKHVEKEVRSRLAAEEEKNINERLLIQQSKMASMGEMLAAIAHQWRQPINAISLLVQMQKDLFKSGKSDKESFDKFARSVLEQIDFMVATMDSFKNFFKPSKEIIKMGLRREIESAVSLISYQFRFLNIEVHIDGEEVVCLGYPNEFKQVVLNILNNAKDAFLERNLKEGAIEITISKEEGFGVATLKDNAGGISPDLLPDKIFECFTSTKGDGGSGIGLSLAKTIIEKNMRGALSVQNSSVGAIFYVKLPLAGW